MTITRENYHDFWAISNSSLSYALPECGGSYKKFVAFMAGELKKEETEEMKLGTLIHKLLESRYTFKTIVIETMPSEALCRIVKEIKTDTRIELKDYAKEVIASARYFGYQKTWGDEAIAKKVLTECSEYFKALRSGAEIIDKSIDIKINGIFAELMKEHNILIDDSMFKSLQGPDWEVQKEAAFTWSENNIAFKMLIDRLEINHKVKEVVFYDYKTTSTPMSYYTGYMGVEIEGEKPQEMQLTNKFHHGSLIRYHVPRQIQFYKRGLSSIFPDYKITGNVLAIEVNHPYEIKLVSISKIPVYETLGELMINKALDKVKEYFDKEISL